METRRCYTCYKSKPLDQFHKQHNGVKGCAPSCKKCKLAYNKEHYKKNKEAYHKSSKVARKKWGEENGKARVREHARSTNHKRRCQRKEGDTILISDLYERDKGICGICKAECSHEDASIDHKIPLSRNGSHTWNNVQLAHLKCNMQKGNRRAA